MDVVMKEMSSICWKNYFEYSETSPTGLIHKTSRGTRKAGDVAGSLKKSTGYFTVGLDKSVYQVHRVIWCIVNGELTTSDVIDHIDGNKTNNLISNLRKIPWEKNSRNSKKRSDNTSSVTGVYLHYCRGFPYWAARVETPAGCKVRYFSFSKYGEQTAYSLACEARYLMIKELNSAGMDYTRRHGT